MNSSKLNRYSASREALIKILVKHLIKNEYIFTTLQRAKSTQRVIEKLITKMKMNTLHQMRIVNKTLDNKESLFQLRDLSKKITRTSGYTSIKKVGIRKGDGATLVCLKIL